MLHAKVVDIKKEKIKLSNAENFIASSKCGASIYFVGTVRDQNNNKKVSGITYDSHDAMVVKTFEEIYQNSLTKFTYLSIIFLWNMIIIFLLEKIGKVITKKITFY